MRRIAVEVYCDVDLHVADRSRNTFARAAGHIVECVERGSARDRLKAQGQLVHFTTREHLRYSLNTFFGRGAVGNHALAFARDSVVVFLAQRGDIGLDAPASIVAQGRNSVRVSNRHIAHFIQDGDAGQVMTLTDFIDVDPSVLDLEAEQTLGRIDKASLGRLVIGYVSLAYLG